MDIVSTNGTRGHRIEQNEIWWRTKFKNEISRDQSFEKEDGRGDGRVCSNIKTKMKMYRRCVKVGIRYLRGLVLALART